MVKVFSREALDEETLKKIQAKTGDKAIIKNISGKNITGLIIKAEGKVIDLSLENKVKRLKKVFSI